jgi:hypothetical protein
LSTPPPTPHQNQGIFSAVVDAVKGLSLTNVLVVMLLAIVVIPGYAMWRMLDDPAMLGRFLSSYEEVLSDKWPCTLRIASARGAGDQYGISTGFAYQGSERWTLNVLMDRKPTDQEMVSYCETLNLLIDFMRDPNARSPYFPGTEVPVVNMYPREPSPP